MNTKANGNGAGGDPGIQVNPVEVANIALMFLGRVDFKRHERGQFDLCEALLQAIAQGKVALTQPVQNQEPAVMSTAPPLDA
jgi:hypothetical protein